MRKISIKVSRTAILAIVAIVLVFISVAIFQEKSIPRREAPKVPSVPLNQGGTEMIIKGCLFELGINKEQITIHDRIIKVESHKVYTINQIEFVFKPLTKYGNVDLKDNRHVLVQTGIENWEIEFIYPPQNKFAVIIHPRPVIPALPGVRMAIIVDDMGPDMKPAELLASIDGDLTFSILPMRPHSQEVARYLYEKGHEVMLHLPMQGSIDHDPGAGAIFKGMDPDQIRTILLEDINSVPYISGVNNHMGSEATQDRDIMMLVETELKKRGLFYIDSLTSSKTMGFKVAQEIGLPWNKRDVFLDNEQNDAYIMGQLEELKSLAKKRSSAIGICHPNTVTIAVLQREVPKLKDEGITLVRVSKLNK